MQVEGYDIDIVVQGYPGKSVCHGSLGWSSIVLLRGAGLVSRDTDMTYDPAISRASIDVIWELWRRRPDSIVVPGHDLPMTQEDGRPQYLGQREAAISCWYGDGMDQTTLFELTLPMEAAAPRVRAHV